MPGQGPEEVPGTCRPHPPTPGHPRTCPATPCRPESTLRQGGPKDSAFQLILLCLSLLFHRLRGPCPDQVRRCFGDPPSHTRPLLSSPDLFRRPIATRVQTSPRRFK